MDRELAAYAHREYTVLIGHGSGNDWATKLKMRRPFSCEFDRVRGRSAGRGRMWVASRDWSCRHNMIAGMVDAALALLRQPDDPTALCGLERGRSVISGKGKCRGRRQGERARSLRRGETRGRAGTRVRGRLPDGECACRVALCSAGKPNRRVGQTHPSPARRHALLLKYIALSSPLNVLRAPAIFVAPHNPTNALIAHCGRSTRPAVRAESTPVRLVTADSSLHHPLETAPRVIISCPGQLSLHLISFASLTMLRAPSTGPAALSTSLAHQ